MTADTIAEWSASRVVHGAALERHEVAELGAVTLWEWPTHADAFVRVAGTPSYLDDVKDSLFKDVKPGTVVATVRVRASDHALASTLSDVAFRRFENLVQYMMRFDAKSFDVGVFRFDSETVLLRLLQSTTHASAGATFVGAYRPVALDNPHFQLPAHRRLWEIAAKDNRTEIEKRLLVAAEWIGRARRDDDHPKAFVQCVFALEAMLQQVERGILVSPSIGYRIAEACAYLLGTTFESRAAAAKQVNGIYSQRSGIVHSGEASVSRDDYQAALRFVSSVHAKLLTEPALKGLSKAAELGEWVQRQKYGVDNASPAPGQPT